MADLRSVLMEIRQEQGRLTPQGVVDSSRDPGAPLHDRFEWDDSLAGEKYRISQARDLIRSVKITFVDEQQQVVKAPRFVSVVRPDEGPSYEPLEEVADDEFVSRLVLREAERAWRQLLARYRHIGSFMQMVAAEAAQVANGE